MRLSSTNLYFVMELGGYYTAESRVTVLMRVTSFSNSSCVKKLLYSFACNKNCLIMLHGFAILLLKLFIKHTLNQNIDDSI